MLKEELSLAASCRNLKLLSWFEVPHLLNLDGFCTIHGRRIWQLTIKDTTRAHLSHHATITHTVQARRARLNLAWHQAVTANLWTRKLVTISVTIDRFIAKHIARLKTLWQGCCVCGVCKLRQLCISTRAKINGEMPTATVQQARTGSDTWQLKPACFEVDQSTDVFQHITADEQRKKEAVHNAEGEEHRAATDDSWGCNLFLGNQDAAIAKAKTLPAPRHCHKRAQIKQLKRMLIGFPPSAACDTDRGSCVDDSTTKIRRRCVQTTTSLNRMIQLRRDNITIIGALMWT
mmetsp:Transcript_9161/g.14536  ORF Transcript_9161/g.14536 Transcript_9161/m.14536 type:complete len:290 (-) Transcript_9161:232-1101(-)